MPLLAAAVPTVAASPPPANPAAIKPAADPEIVVVGERVPRRLRDTASSVAVFRPNEIDALAVSDRLDNLIALVPNVQVGAGSDAPTFRGLDSTGVLQGLPAFLGGTRPRATLQIDGRPTGFNEFVFGIASLWDVDQVEIYRTPQTTTQGRNSIAGGIFISTADPEREWRARGRIIAGTGERRQASAMLTGPLLGDQLGFRLSGDLERGRPASRIAPLLRGADPNHERQALLRLKLLARPNALPGARITLTLAHSTGQSPQIVGLAPPFRARRDDNPGYGIFRTMVDSASLIAAIPISDRLISTNTATTSRSSFRRFAVPGLGEAHNHLHDLSLESLLNWRPSTALQVRGGINRLSSKLEQKIDLTQFGRLAHFGDRQHSLGLFGEIEWHPLPQLALTIGARRQQDDQHRVGVLIKPNGSSPIDYRGRFGAWLPKLTVAYNASDALTGGFLIQKAYNPGGATVTLRGDTDSFDAETLWDYELFARGALHGGKLRYSANLFVNRIRKAQRQQVESLTLPSGAIVQNIEYANAPKARSRGVELSLDWRATPRLRLQGALGLLATRIVRTLDPIDPIRGRDFARSPHLSGSATIDWRPLDPLRLSAQLRSHTRYFSNDANSQALAISGATLVDARAAYDFGPASVSLYARNLFDRFALTYRFDPGLAIAEDPRRVGIEVETRF